MSETTQRAKETGPAHRVSIAPSGSSSSIAPLPPSNPCPNPSPSSAFLKRTVSALSSNDDNSMQLKRKCKLCKPNEIQEDRRLTRFVNARVLRRDGSLLRGSMDVDPNTGLIVEINLNIDESGEQKHQETLMQLSQNTNNHANVVDCQDRILSSGFIDIQLNGAYGVDFSNADPSSPLTVDNVLEVAKKLTSTGVTSFCPTMVSSSRETYRHVIPLLKKARERQCEESSKQNENGANILGMHLEGPFFAPSKRGAHDDAHIVAPSNGMASVKEVYGLENSNDAHLEDIDIITMAPELDGALGAIQSLTAPNKDNGHIVVISCGHTEATYQDGILAVTHGATLLTHLYNAMNPFHHRNPGLVGLLSSESKLGRVGLERPFYSMIVDGIHVHESAVCMAYNCHPRGCVLVTDAMAAMGLGNGTRSLGNMSVCIQGDRATLLGSDTLAGSVVSMDACVRRFQQFTGCSIGEALLCATLHPAAVLKRDVVRSKGVMGYGVSDAPIGVLEVGASADLVLLSDDLEVLGTWVGGTKAFERITKLN